MSWMLMALALAGPDRVSHPDTSHLHDWLAVHHKELAGQATWASPTADDRDAMVAGLSTLALAIDTCADGPLERATAELARAGQALSVHTTPETTVVVISDTSSRGLGWSAWRCADAVEVVVQAPHAFHDLGTRPLAFEAFFRSDLRGLQANTVHRYRAEPDELPADEVHPADVTRQPASAFHTTALVWAVMRPTVRLLQLHGFADSTTDADVVLSTGNAAEAPERVAHALLAMGFDAKAYGEDVEALGGTRNALSRALSDEQGRFLHLELSRTTRKTLQADDDLWDRMVRAVTETRW